MYLSLNLKTISLTALMLAVATATLVAPAISIADELFTEGQKLAFDQNKGNCLACHVISDGELPGNIGPPLIEMNTRFPDRAVLRSRIYDARITNPDTIMTPFGPHGVMTDAEIDKVTDYIHSL